MVEVDKAGKIKTVRTARQTRLYDISSVAKERSKQPTSKQKLVFNTHGNLICNRIFIIMDYGVGDVVLDVPQS